MAKKQPLPELTRAIHSIRLAEVNSGKLAALDAVWAVYKPLCEQYLKLFCTEVKPDAEIDFCFASPLSARWQREAVRQATGIAKSWRSNRKRRWHEYSEKLAWYETLDATKQQTRKKPEWVEPRIPELHQVSIQASTNVAEQVKENDKRVLALEAAQTRTYDFWLRLSTLEKGQPVYLPVKLARHHRKMLDGHVPNSNLTLSRRDGWWWLSLSICDPLPKVIETNEAIGLDTGIVNFLTDSVGNHFGTIGRSFMKEVEQVSLKTARKAKLRACLKKKGVPKEKLPSTSSVRAQRLSRRVKHDIETAVVQCFDAHPQTLFVVENLDVSGMRFKARRMNRYLKASQIGHIQDHLYWTAAKRGVPVIAVPAAYSSQECPRCHYADRSNRPNQQTFCCVKCGYKGHADVVAAGNLECRLNDTVLCNKPSKEDIKALLDDRHARWLVSGSS